MRLLYVCCLFLRFGQHKQRFLLAAFLLLCSCFFGRLVVAFWLAFFVLCFKRPSDIRIAFLITLSALDFCFWLFLQRPESGDHNLKVWVLI